VVVVVGSPVVVGSVVGVGAVVGSDGSAVVVIGRSPVVVSLVVVVVSVLVVVVEGSPQARARLARLARLRASFGMRPP
jgi:hypothetical protein